MGINSGYRCLKCEGKNSPSHGLYCPNKKNNAEKLIEKIKKQTNEVYNE